MSTLLRSSASEPEVAVSRRNSHQPDAHRRFYPLVLLTLSLVLYLGTASWPALLDDADASHALVAREMLQRGDFVVMFLNGIRYLQKAPLHYWMVAADYALLGPTEFAGRLHQRGHVHLHPHHDPRGHLRPGIHRHLLSLPAGLDGDAGLAPGLLGRRRHDGAGRAHSRADWRGLSCGRHLLLHPADGPHCIT